MIAINKHLKKKFDVSQRSTPLRQSGGDGSELGVDLPRRGAQDQTAEGVPGNLDVDEGAENVDLLVGDDDPGAGAVLDGELGLSPFAGEPADGPLLVLAAQRLHVLDLEGLDVEVVQAEEGDRVCHVEAEHEGVHEVSALLQVAHLRRVPSGLQFDLPGLRELKNPRTFIEEH